MDSKSCMDSKPCAKSKPCASGTAGFSTPNPNLSHDFVNIWGYVRLDTLPSEMGKPGPERTRGGEGGDGEGGMREGVKPRPCP